MHKLLAIALSAGLAYSIVGSLGSEAEAAKRRGAAGKVCSATNSMGAKVTWRCAANQKCCSGFMGIVSCSAPGVPCM
jgi:hypothetical protein